MGRKVEVELDDFTVAALEAALDKDGVTGDDRLAWMLATMAEAAARGMVALSGIPRGVGLTETQEAEARAVFERVIERGTQDFEERRNEQER